MAQVPRNEADEKSAQEIIERAAEVTNFLFRAPHPAYGYAIILLAPFLLAPLFLQLVPTTATITISAAAYAIALIYVVPTAVFAAASHRLARLLGGTFNRRRAVFLAAVILLVQLVIVLVGGLLAQRGFIPFLDVLILAYSVIVMPYHVALFTTSDNRQIPTSIISLFHPVIGLIAIHYLVPTGPREIWLSVLLPPMFLVTTVFFTQFVDVPFRRNTGLSLSEMFRHYLDHLRTGDVRAELLIDKIGGEIDAHVGAVTFRRMDGQVKCAIVVPAVHPGPIGHLGGSNLPAKVAAAVRETSNVLVPHGPATHDFNPTSTREVERIAEEARRLITGMEYSTRASPLIRRGTDAQVCSQVFGDGVLLTYTSWPKPIDDIDFGVGHAAMVSARAAGLKEAIFVDAHNSLTLGSGAVFPSTTRAWEIVEMAEKASRDARERVSGNLRAGYAEDKRSFTRMEGIGEQGCQVIVTEVDGVRTAYVLWDGNNMMSDVRARIRDAISDLVDEFEVMTTDNHSVNTVAGGYNPVGYRLEHERIAAVARKTLEAAIEDLEPVEAGLKTSRILGLRVLGHWTTMRLISSARTALSTIPRAATAMLVMQATLAALIIIGVGWFNPPVGSFRFPWP